MAPLDEYRKKRDFRRTPEPAGQVSASPGEGGGLFVVHKHATQRLHFDLRLEQDGVLRSWAVPKGPSLDPGEKRLAVEVEDHPLEYGEFEGVIPEDEYGGGTVMLWDRGHWRPRKKPSDDRLDFELEGHKLTGAWTLVRMSGERSDDGKNWLLIKRSDESGANDATDAADTVDASVITGRTMREIASDRDAIWTAKGSQSPSRPQAPDAGRLAGSRKRGLAADPQPQLASLVDEAPVGDDWLHEIKFDGYRILARLEREGDELTARLLSRNGKDWTDRFAKLAPVLARLPADSALVDGEVVAFSADGSSSFRRLQEALSEGRTGHLVYQAFDLLYLGGYDLTATPLLERKRALAGLLAGASLGGSGTVRVTDHQVGKGPAFFEQACGLGLEGIISKRRDAPYRPGRGKDWVKVKCTRQEELLIGGFSDPSGSRAGFGALLLGAYDESGKLVYAGKVGTGFSDRHLRELHGRLRELEVAEAPFDSAPSGRGVHWVRPVLVAEVEFTEWTRDGALRHPSFRGLREDREPEEIRMPAAMSVSKRTKAGSGNSKRDEGVESGKPVGERSERRPRKGEAQVAGVRLSSPDRVLYPEQGVTKLALAQYYEDIAEWILPHLANRPLSLVRCPQGREKQCFFQKHPDEALAKDTARVEIEESDGPAPYLYARTLADIVSLVQAGVLELHVWGSRVDDVERPDILVFDLDPAPDVPWSEMLRAVRELRDRLAELGLESFPRTTGGKGLHLVVPLERGPRWDEAKEFAHAVAKAHESDDRRRITTNMSKAKRRGKIFLDYLRNGRGATAIASYSTRSREGAPVAVPVRWDELGGAMRADRYDISNLRRRLAALRSDPWAEFDEARRPLTKKMLARVGPK